MTNDLVKPAAELKPGETFKKMLGVRALIQASVKLDQEIIHEIHYNYGAKRFHILMAAMANTAAVPAWMFEMVVEGDKIQRVMNLFGRMLQHEEKMHPKEAKYESKKFFIPGK